MKHDLFIYFVNDFPRLQELQHFEKVPLSNSRKIGHGITIEII
jgi:hypothetical protein